MTQAKKRSSKPKITVSKNGPYLVDGYVPIRQKAIVADAEGTATGYETKAEHATRESCALCRCGQSSSKPFCDGTHLKINFDGTETAQKEEYLDKPDIIEGDNLRLIDVKELCASARFCHREGGIWKLASQKGSPKAERLACEEAADCPSGRLTMQDKRRGDLLEPNLKPAITLIEDPSVGVSGPVYVQGGISVESCEGKLYRVRNRVTLCRCGKSANKPFCDSSHYPE